MVPEMRLEFQIRSCRTLDRARTCNLPVAIQMMFDEWFNRLGGGGGEETKNRQKRGYSGLLEFAFNSTYFSFIVPNTRI